MNLTDKQQAVLDSMKRQGGEVPIPGGSTSSTIRALDNKGMIDPVPDQPDVYRLTKAGRKAAN